MTLREYIADVERAYIEKTLEASSSREEAAKKLGVSLRTLYYKLRRHHLGGQPVSLPTAPAGDG